MCSLIFVNYFCKLKKKKKYFGTIILKKIANKIKYLKRNKLISYRKLFEISLQQIFLKFNSMKIYIKPYRCSKNQPTKHILF